MNILRLPIKIIVVQSMLILSTQTQCMEQHIHNLRTFLKTISPTLSAMLHNEQIAIDNNKYNDQVAYVQHNPGISSGEHECLNKRKLIVKEALKAQFNYPLKDSQIPTMAIIGSGGGYRAMLYFTAILRRLHRARLLNAITYMSLLSGSTWAGLTWLATGMPIEEFATYIQQCTSKGLNDISREEKLLMIQDIIVHKEWHLVNIYGDLLTHRLLEALGDKKYAICLSDLAETIQDGTYPYPICVAIDGRDTETARQDPTVYEFTPHTIGEHTNNTAIPSWAKGRKYKHDKSIDTVPENNLADDFATFGSAFGVSIQEILEEVLQDHPELLELVKYICTPIDGDRIIPCYTNLPNYHYKSDIQGITDPTLLKDKIMTFVDAGVKINLFDYVPVSKRNADIMLFIDMSAGEKVGREFKKVVKDAQQHKLPFPTIDLTNIAKQTISIFKGNPIKKIPTVIYMPAISDPELWEAHKAEFPDYNLYGFNLHHETNNGFAKTQNFQYSIPNSTQLMSQADFNMATSENKIWQEIEWTIKQKS
jgi:hypothetical protein